LRNGAFDFRKTLSRGQWGASQDDGGRIYRNSNESVLHVDVVPTPYYARNPYMLRTRGSYESLEGDNREVNTVWPAPATPGVNRGYQNGILRADGSLAAYTSANSPLVYRGDRLPSELYGRAIQDAMDRRPLAAAAGIAGLLAEGAVLFFLSGRVHRRVIDAADSHRGMRAAGRLASAGFRLPLLGDAASAVAFAQLRTALRSIRGRLIVLMPGPMLSLVTFVSLSLPNDRWGQTLAGRGYLLLGMGSIMALYTLQAFTMNLFGTDRAGLSLQFLSPVSDRDLARGKIAGLAMVYSIALVLCLGGALFVVPGGSPWLWAAALLSGYATFLWISPFAVWFSALFPVAGIRRLRQHSRVNFGHVSTCLSTKFQPPG